MSRILLSAIVALLGVSAIQAQERPKHIRVESVEHSQARAGYPAETSRFARPANSSSHSGGWVGGGGFLNFGRGKTENEGTWGWDYVGPGWRPSRIFMSWSNRKHEKKGGTYEADGKYHVPDVFAIKKPGKE